MSNFNQQESLVEKRAIIVGRCSTDEQARTPSISKQLEINKHFCEREQIVIVEELPLEGMSASEHDHEPILRRLIDRKETKDDFDILVFMDYDRFSRDLPMGRRLWDEFLDADIEIVSATESRVGGELGFLNQDLILYKSQAFVRSLAKHTSTGVTQSINDGRILPVTNVIYGLDKLFLGPDATTLFILRDLLDGRKVKLNPKDGAVIEYVLKRANERCVQKRRSDIIRPIPGNPAHVKVVRDIFRWRLIEQLNTWKIARRLNERGILSPRGQEWQHSAVRSLLMNTIYTGSSIGCRVSYSKHAMRGTKGPVMHSTRRKKPKGRKGHKLINRPKDDWHVVPVPEMADFLDADVREVAKKWHEDELNAAEERRKARGEKREVVNAAGRASGGNRHDPNMYILSGIMRSKPGNHVMKGWSTPGSKGRNGHRFRYYVIEKFMSIPMPGDVRRRHINAIHVEDEVLNALAETLTSYEGLDARIAEHINLYCAQRVQDRHDLTTLKEQLAEVESQSHLLSHELSKEARELFKGKAEQLASQKKHLAARIDAAMAEIAATPEDAAAITKVIKSQFTNLAGAMKERTLSATKRLVTVFVSRCVADLATKEVEIEFALPGWGFSKKRPVEEMCLVESPAHRGAQQTNSLQPLILARYSLSYHFRILKAKGSKAWYSRQRLPFDPPDPETVPSGGSS